MYYCHLIATITLLLLPIVTITAQPKLHPLNRFDALRSNSPTSDDEKECNKQTDSFDSEIAIVATDYDSDEFTKIKQAKKTAPVKHNQRPWIGTPAAAITLSPEACKIQLASRITDWLKKNSDTFASKYYAKKYNKDESAMMKVVNRHRFPLASLAFLHHAIKTGYRKDVDVYSIPCIAVYPNVKHACGDSWHEHGVLQIAFNQISGECFHYCFNQFKQLQENPTDHKCEKANQLSQKERALAKTIFKNLEQEVLAYLCKLKMYQFSLKSPTPHKQCNYDKSRFIEENKDFVYLEDAIGDVNLFICKITPQQLKAIQGLLA